MNEFFLKYKELAQNSQRVTGVPASVTLAQAYLESGAGKSSLTVQDNNFFGIKAGSKWIGKKSLWATWEYIPYSKKTYYTNYFNTEGRQIISISPYSSDKEKWRVKDYFRKYDSAEDSFTDHAQIYSVKKAKEIVSKIGDNLDYKLWATALKQAGYATDINYHNKIINLIEQNNLSALDSEAAKKKLTNATYFFLVTLILTVLLVYLFKTEWLNDYKNYFFIFIFSTFTGVIFYLAYLQFIDTFYYIQSE